MSGRENTRIISANDLHVIMGRCLDTAQQIHLAMCLFDDVHAAQANLNYAMSSVLVVAEQCRQLHASGKYRLMSTTDSDNE